MEIEDFINKWKAHSDPRNLDLSNVYSVLFYEQDYDASNILTDMDIDEEDLFNCDGKVKEEILQSLKAIDDLMKKTTVIMKNYIIETVFKEVENEQLLEKYKFANQKLTVTYNQIMSEFKKIDEILFNYYPPSFTLSFTTNDSKLE